MPTIARPVLTTAEIRFGAEVAKKIERDDPARLLQVTRFVAEHPSLWPFYVSPPQGQEFVPPTGTAPKPVLPVRVNWGVWQTPCPFCPSAQHASKTEHWFFCAGCMNAANGHLTIPVLWPDDADEIERLLLLRPYLSSRNWEPYETVKDLRRENDLYLKLAKAGVS